MAQWVKVFPAHTHEDLCLGSQHPHKSLIWGFSPITPAVRGGVRREEADDGSSLASQSSRNSQLQIQ